MPRIIEYEAPDRRLTPDERGNEAFTRAGRYTGQYIRQTAEDVKQGGILQGQEIRQRGWPFDILAIEEAQAKQKQQGGSVQVRSGGGGGGIRNVPTRTDGASLDAAARRELDGYSAVSGRYKTSAATRSQISSGARVLGNISRALAANTEAGLGDPSGVSVLHGTQDTMLDPDTGLYVTDPSAPQLAAMRKQYANDLSYMQAGGPNAGADAAANQRGDLIGAAGATGQYWKNYYGVPSTADGGISNGVDPNSVDQYGNPNGEVSAYAQAADPNNWAINSPDNQTTGYGDPTTNPVEGALTTGVENAIGMGQDLGLIDKSSSVGDFSGSSTSAFPGQ